MLSQGYKWRGLGIRPKLLVGIGLIVLLLAAIVPPDLIDSWNSYRRAARAERANLVIEDIVAAFRNLALERERVLVALSLAEPLNGSTASDLIAWRTQSGLALQRTLDRLASDTSIDLPDLHHQIEAAWARLQVARIEADHASLSLGTASNLFLGRRWFATLSDSMGVLQRMASALTAIGPMDDPSANALLQARLAMLDLRDAAGGELALLMGPAATGRPLSTDMIRQLAALDARIDRSWLDIATLEPVLRDPAVASSLSRTKELFSAHYLPVRNALDEILRQRSFPADPRHLPGPETSMALDGILAVVDATLQAERNVAAARSASALRHVIYESFSAVTLLLLLTVIGWLALVRVVGPVQRVTAAMRQMAVGRTEPDLPVAPDDDEVGAMILALREYGRTVGRRESEMAELTRRHGEVAAHIPDMIYRFRSGTDGAGVFEYVSPRCFELNGIAAERVLENPALLFDLHPQQARAQFWERMREAGGDPVPLHWEGAILTDGRRRWMRLEATPHRAADGSVIWDGTQSDVTTTRALEERQSELARELERRVAERTRALSASETRLHRILDHIADMVVTIDEQGLVESFNKAAETAFGYRAEGIIGREASLLLAERDRARHDKQLRRYGDRGTDDAGGRAALDVEALRSDGSSFSIELDIDEIELDARRLFIATMRDVSERRRIEDRMRRSEQQLSLVTNALPVLIAYLDADLRYRYVNKTFVDWWQAPVEQVIGRTVREAVGPEAFDTVRPYFEAALRGETLTFDREILHPDGQKRLCHAYYVPHIDESGRVVGVVALAEDVTERRRGEQALRESQESLANAQRIAHIGNWDWVVATGKVGWSDEVFRIFGFEVGAFQPSYDAFHHLIHPDDRDAIVAAASKSRRGERHYQIDYRIIRPDGEQRIVHEEGEITRNEAGQPVYLAGTVQDVTEQRAMEAQLQQAQKMEAVGQLTGGIAHDFNNLLGVIIGNLDLLAIRSEARPDDHGLIRRAIEAAERGASLTHHLLAFSRRQALQPRRVDVNSLVTGMSELLNRTLGEAVDVRIVLGEKIWSVNVDRVQLESAILNLAINARDAMGDGGRLSIATANQTFEEADVPADGAIQPGDYVIISVSDNGIGMNPDVLAHVFEPFFTTKEVGKGTGLGLSMVYGFVKQSGGHVTIYSESGYGTTVKLYLPRMHGAVDVVAPKLAEPVARGKGHRVLVVEDNPAMLVFSRNALTTLGYETILAETAPEALQLLSSDETIDVLFTDVILGTGMSGFDVAREAQRLRPGLHVLFTSGFVEHDMIAAEGVDPGIELLTKPFRTAELGRRLALLLSETVS